MIPDKPKKKSLQDVIWQESRISASPACGLAGPARQISDEWIVIGLPSLRSVHQ